MADMDNTRWVGSWTTAPVVVDGVALDGQTVRMNARISLGGGTMRIRLSNAFGKGKLDIGAAHVALRGEGAAILPDFGRALTFNGAPSTTIPAGALAVSDPVALAVPSLADLAVSVYLPGSVSEDFQITGHGNARQTNYISSPGDFTGAAELPGAAATENNLFVTGIEVLAQDGTGGIVALGDSLTDGNISSVDAYNRWPDQLARRLAARSGGRSMGVMNLGTGGGRILHDQRGDSALKRFDRDVLGQAGATHLIVFIGINDIRNRWRDPAEEVTARQMIDGLDQIALRAKSAGLKVFGGTLLTFEHENFNPPPGLPGLYTPEGEEKRLAVNAWIRDSGAFDAVFDFEKALRDPDHPTRMLPEYDCDDHLHPNDAGYCRLGDIIDLGLFE